MSNKATYSEKEKAFIRSCMPSIPDQYWEPNNPNGWIGYDIRYVKTYNATYFNIWVNRVAEKTKKLRKESFNGLAPSWGRSAYLSFAGGYTCHIELTSFDMNHITNGTYPTPEQLFENKVGPRAYAAILAYEKANGKLSNRKRAALVSLDYYIKNDGACDQKWWTAMITALDPLPISTWKSFLDNRIIPSGLYTEVATYNPELLIANIGHIQRANAITVWKYQLNTELAKRRVDLLAWICKQHRAIDLICNQQYFSRLHCGMVDWSEKNITDFIAAVDSLNNDKNWIVDDIYGMPKEITIGKVAYEVEPLVTAPLMEAAGKHFNNCIYTHYQKAVKTGESAVYWMRPKQSNQYHIALSVYWPYDHPRIQEIKYVNNNYLSDTNNQLWQEYIAANPNKRKPANFRTNSTELAEKINKIYPLSTDPIFRDSPIEQVEVIVAKKPKKKEKPVTDDRIIEIEI